MKKPFKCRLGKHEFKEFFTYEKYRVCVHCDYTEKQGSLTSGFYKIKRSGIVWSVDQLKIMNINIFNLNEYHSNGLFNGGRKHENT